MEEEGWMVVTYKKKVWAVPKEMKGKSVKISEREVSDEIFPEPKHYKCKKYEYE